MARFLAILTLVPQIVFSNPTSGWYEDYSYHVGSTDDFSVIPYVLILLAIFFGPYLISKIIDFFKPNKKEPEIIGIPPTEEEKKKMPEDQRENLF
tara:strand:- start:4241 stop:4525 length:285 start_codon:yes stop_codon:yes gene_type:complete